MDIADPFGTELVDCLLRLTTDAPRTTQPRYDKFDDLFMAVDSLGVPFEVDRTWRHIAEDTKESLIFGFLDLGQQRIMQNGREVFLTAGDFALLDTTRPYSIETPMHFATRTFQIPKQALGLDGVDISHLTGTAMRQSHALSAFLIPYLNRLADDTQPLHHKTRLKLAHNVTDILATLIGETLHEMPLEDAARRTLVLRVKTFINAHLDDATLSPVTIAAAHRISVRYLHKIFAAEDTTVSRWILHARLERCRAVLAAHDRREVTITDLCYTWGFASPAHFSRAFHNAYGMPPREWQQLARARRRR
ncbi:helix-turn-helix domain-containing protein [Nocardia puris]|uniref:AraC-like DNA-binding protein n=1 Tax=Nocardia puris TaxID=208602 RepID=A0A366D5E0_9NOCA|nr:helix-turn-helix domain-containing protein [Nocardia puris]MBF6370375.1 helix-turn-helix domain-containing protein [Nocardia puris]RBO85186.1 AraC-like DNA-binding protein [Nocardia puris]